MSQNNIDNIAEGFVHSFEICFLYSAFSHLCSYFRTFWHQENLQVLSIFHDKKKAQPQGALYWLKINTIYRQWTWPATAFQTYTAAHLMGKWEAPWGTFTLHTTFSPGFPGSVKDERVGIKKNVKSLFCEMWGLGFSTCRNWKDLYFIEVLYKWLPWVEDRHRNKL